MILLVILWLLAAVGAGFLLATAAEKAGERRRARIRRRNWLAWSCVSVQPDQRRWCHRCWAAHGLRGTGPYSPVPDPNWACRGDSHEDNPYLYRPRPVVNENYLTRITWEL